METTQELDSVKVAYLAGFFDGEGNIRIAKNSKNAKGYYLRISATQVNPAPLRAFIAAFGGHLYERPARRGRDGHTRQPIWDWIVAGPGAAHALTVLHPFLIVKREAAEIGLRFQASVRPRAGRRTSLTADELTERQVCAALLTVRTNHQRIGGVDLGR